MKHLWIVIGIAFAFSLVVISPLLVKAQSDSPSFAVASIKPNNSENGYSRLDAGNGRFFATNITAKALVEYAFSNGTYDLVDNNISGGPEWAASKGYDIDARIDDAVYAEWKALPDNEQIRRMRIAMQSLLADRFKLVVTRATKQVPIYALVIAKGGTKLKKTPPSAHSTSNDTAGSLEAHSITMDRFARLLYFTLGRDRVIENQTGLEGTYDISFQWTPQRRTNIAASDALASDADDGTTIFDALKDQLGLELESTDGNIDVIVIDNIEEPTPN